MLDAAFYDLLMETFDACSSAAIAAHAHAGETDEPRPALLQLRAGLAESPGWYLVQAIELAPAPLTVESLRVRDIYASERLVQALLELMASEQWLDRDQAGAYRLSTAGHELAQRSAQRRMALAASLTGLPAGELDALASSLGRLIDASLDAPTPPGTWCLAHSRNRAPAAGAPALAQIFQYFSDFNAFRDDAHMAAWRPLGVAGYEWEAFALVCAGAASSGAELFARLAHRGYSRAEYTAALEACAQRGWLEPGSGVGTFQASAAGQAVHAEVEHATDSYFYTPWAILSEEQIDALRDTLISICERLQATPDS